MSSLDDIYIEKRLSSVVNTQESIQSLSLWALHHKTQHQKIVNIWLHVLRSAELDLRLSLFYLCNEMVQTCKKRNADSFKESFKGVLAEAVILVRDSQVRSNVERIFRIWIERNVYEAEYVEELLSVLYNQKPKAEAKRLAEFKPGILLDAVKSFAKMSRDVENKKKSLELLPFDVKEIDSFQQRLRDDGTCEEEYFSNFEQMSKLLREYILSLESELKERKLMLDLLHLSEIYYEDQYTDVSVVVQAYRNFGNRISNLKVKLMEYRKLIPDPLPRSPADFVAEESSAEPLQTEKKVSESSQNDDTSNSGLESILPKLERGFMTFLPRRIPSLGSQCAADLTENQLVNKTTDEGDSTPVQDEEPDEPLLFDNPMEFLSQLINKSTKQQILSSVAATERRKDERDSRADGLIHDLSQLPTDDDASSFEALASFNMTSAESDVTLNTSSRHNELDFSKNTMTTISLSGSVNNEESSSHALLDVQKPFPGQINIPDNTNYSNAVIDFDKIYQSFPPDYVPSSYGYDPGLCNPAPSFMNISTSGSAYDYSDTCFRNNYEANKTYIPLAGNAFNCMENSWVETSDHSLVPQSLETIKKMDVDVETPNHHNVIGLLPPYMTNNRLHVHKFPYQNASHQPGNACPQQFHQIPFNQPQFPQERFPFREKEHHVGHLDSGYGSSSSSLFKQNASPTSQFGLVSSPSSAAFADTIHSGH